MSSSGELTTERIPRSSSPMSATNLAHDDDDDDDDDDNDVDDDGDDDDDDDDNDDDDDDVDGDHDDDNDDDDNVENVKKSIIWSTEKQRHGFCAYLSRVWRSQIITQCQSLKVRISMGWQKKKKKTHSLYRRLIL